MSANRKCLLETSGGSGQEFFWKDREVGGRGSGRPHCLFPLKLRRRLCWCHHPTIKRIALVCHPKGSKCFASNSKQRVLIALAKGNICFRGECIPRGIRQDYAAEKTGKPLIESILFDSNKEDIEAFCFLTIIFAPNRSK